MEGQGKLVSPNGDRYEGQWHRGKKHGTGRLLKASESYEYDGDFLWDKRHGHGIQKNINNDGAYMGEWKLGRREGRGRNLRTY